VLWPIFEGLNDWKIVKCVPGKSDDKDDANMCRNVVLEGLTSIICEQIQEHGYGAIDTIATDECPEGFYLVQWTGLPYTLQQDTVCYDSTPPLKLKSGEMVCKA